MLVDFTAEWCGACNELSRITFADPKVMTEASRFVAVKVDATHEDDPSIDLLKDRYRVVGLPTVILVGSDGRERTRFTEFVPPERFLLAIRAIEGARRLGLPRLERAYWRACELDAGFKNGQLKEREEALAGLLLELMETPN